MKIKTIDIIKLAIGVNIENFVYDEIVCDKNRGKIYNICSVFDKIIYDIIDTCTPSFSAYIDDKNNLNIFLTAEYIDIENSDFVLLLNSSDSISIERYDDNNLKVNVILNSIL